MVPYPFGGAFSTFYPTRQRERGRTAKPDRDNFIDF